MDAMERKAEMDRLAAGAGLPEQEEGGLAAWNIFSLFEDRPQCQQATADIKAAIDAGDGEELNLLIGQYEEVGADDTASREEMALYADAEEKAGRLRAEQMQSIYDALGFNYSPKRR